MKVYIGTAGYAYPAWVGGFDPAGTRAGEMLGYYAGRFPVVEINATFHRPPTAEQLARMARKVPAGFRFSLKVPKTVSHDRDPAALPAFRLAAEQLWQPGALLAVVAQFPESFHDTRPNRDWLARVAGELRPVPVAVEVRHRSWDTPGLPPWLAELGVDLVSVGVPDLPHLFPAGPRLTRGRVYARLHSQNPESWYAGGPARYDYDYPAPVIRKWAAGLQAAAKQGAADALFFFNNCVGIQAVTNAEKLAQVLAETAPEIEVVPPPEPVRERTLFDGY
jgi:uncharacterized protein YecE (DUF72 family)